VPVIPKGSSAGNVEKENHEAGQLANLGLPGKRPLKQRV